MINFSHSLTPSKRLISSAASRARNYVCKAGISVAIGCVLVVSSVSVNAQSNNAKKSLPPIIMFLLNETKTIEPEDASRFLMQATFGPTYSEIQALTNISYAQWIDQQINLAPTYHYDFSVDLGWVLDNGNVTSGAHKYSWLLASTRAEDQLRQRMAYALKQIFVISEVTPVPSINHTRYVEYYDLLLENAFGNYRDLLEKVTLSSLMGSYLTMSQNSKESEELGTTRPDENFAREIMQLFTIGLWELNIDGTHKKDSNGNSIPSYDDAIIEQFSRLFTGWHYGNAEFFTHRTIPGAPPMVAYQTYHDTTAKVLLEGSSAQHLIPSGMTAESELDAGLDNLFYHPNVGPFVSKQLIQRFVTSNPSPAYVARIANVFNGNNANGSAAQHERGDLEAVIKAILLDDEARNGHESEPETFGKYKEPLIRLISTWRVANLIKRTGFNAQSVTRISYLQQFPYRAQTVFGFFPLDYSPPGELANNGVLAPEGQLLNLESMISAGSLFYGYLIPNTGTDDDNTNTAVIDTTHLQAMLPDDLKRPEKLVDYLNLVMFAGAMPDFMREQLLNLHNQGDYPTSDKQDIVADILYLISISPLFHVQQ